MAQYLTLYEAAKRSQSDLFKGMALSVVTTNEVAARLPFRQFSGLDLGYLREGTPPSAAWIPDDGTLSETSSGTDDLVRLDIRQLGGNIDVVSLNDDLSGGADTAAQIPRKTKKVFDMVLQATMTGKHATSHALSSVADPFAAIGAAGVGGIEYSAGLDSLRHGPGSIKYVHTGTLWSFRAPGDRDYGPAVAIAADGSATLYSDNPNKWIRVTIDVSDATADGEAHIRFASSSDSFDGVNELCGADMVRSSSGVNGDPFSLNILDQLMDAEKVRTNRAFFMNSKLVRAFVSLNRAMGGTDPTHISVPGFSGPSLVFRGIPVLGVDHIPMNEAKGSATDLTSIYLASLDAIDGLFLGVPSRSEKFDVQADPRNIPVLGWRVESIGALEGVNRRRTRVTWAGALGLGSSLGLARAKEIQTFGF